MRNKHSPGPWTINKSEPGNYNVCFRIPNAGLCRTAVVDRIEVADQTIIADEQAEANAHLIAAAPEMLEALEAAVQIFVHGADSYDDILDKVESAIRKARGEQ